MNTARLRSKRVLVPVVAGIALVGTGGGLWAATADEDLFGADRDRVAEAAVTAVGGGTATEVESSDDLGEAYEVEVRREDGTEIDVVLDDQLGVLYQDRDDDDDDDFDDDRDDRRDDDFRRRNHVSLTGPEGARAAQAAVDAVGGGTAVKVETGDDRGEAFEVEVVDANGLEWDLKLDADYQVLHKEVDD